MQSESKGSKEISQQRIKLFVDPKQTPIRVDKFILGRIESISRSKIQKGIKQGMVLVNGGEVKSNYKIKPHDMITIFLQKPSGFENRYKPENIPLDIRYEDEDVLVLHKPPGLVVHPGIGNYSGTLANGLLHYFKEVKLPLKEGDFHDRPGIVHRIDKDTSGLMVIAKNEAAMTHLSKQFFDHTTKREYLALVWGDVSEDKGTIDEYIGRHYSKRLEFTVFPERDEGKQAITHYEIMERLYYVTLVKCKLETGRTHQIRVHFKYLGHPLFNDVRYGGDQILKGTVYTKYKQFVHNAFKLLPRQALHARSLGFVHPRTGKELFFEADLPDDFQQCLDKWRNYLNNRKNS